MRISSALYVLGWSMAIISAAMLVPISFALALDSIKEVQAFTVPTVLIGFVAGCLIIAFRDRDTVPQRRQSLLMLIFIWALIPAAGAMPFYTLGLPETFAASYFEAASGFTTTGATVIANLGDTPESIIIWRALLQWIGGLATLVSLTALLGPLSGSQIEDRQLRFVGQADRQTLQQMRSAIATILPLYGALTALCFVLLTVTGLPPFDAICLAMSTISTGGFMPRDGATVLYDNPAADLVLAIFMTIGAISIIWLRALTQMRWPLVRETREPYIIAGSILLLGLVLTYLAIERLGTLSVGAIAQSFTTGLASAASLISTTGLRVSEHTQASIPYVVLLLIAIVGGGRYSTAGGLKVYRLLTIYRQLGRELRLLVFPHGVRPSRWGEEAADIAIVKSAWITMTAFLLTIAIVALLVASSGVPFNAALMAAAGAVSNLGTVYDFAQPDNFSSAPTFAAMSGASQLALCAGMIIGRFEILAFLSIFLTIFWRD